MEFEVENNQPMSMDEMKSIVYHNMFNETLKDCVDYESLSADIKLKVIMLMANIEKLKNEKCNA